MAKRKEFKYEGLGFPIILLGVETEVHKGEEIPIVNHRKLEEIVFEKLTMTPQRLTGNQLEWVRGFMGLSQTELAKRLAFNSHASVSSWEGKLDDVTGMDPRTEYCLRLEMCLFLNAKPEELLHSMAEFMEMTAAMQIVKVKAA